jgi:hypothetical protein
MFLWIANSWSSFLSYSLKNNWSDFKQLQVMNIKRAAEGKFENTARVHRLSLLIITSHLLTNLIHFHFHNHLQPDKSYKCTQLTPKTASVVPPEDGRLTPETCRGLRHNKVIVKVKCIKLVTLLWYTKIHGQQNVKLPISSISKTRPVFLKWILHVGFVKITDNRICVYSERSEHVLPNR